MKAPRVKRAAGIAAACVLLAGCGGDSGRLSRSQFESRANAACKHAYDRLLTLKRPRTFKELGATAGQQLAIGNELYAALRALRPPAENQKKFDSYLRELRSGIDKFVDLKAAVQRHDIAAARAALNLIAANESGQAAEDLRLRQCSRSVSPPS
jgi:hypothetical protein